jgi:hypothetical protein
VDASADDTHGGTIRARGAPLGIAIARPPLARHSTTALSTARQSFVTAPATPAAEASLAGWTPRPSPGAASAMHLYAHGQHPA